MPIRRQIRNSEPGARPAKIRLLVADENRMNCQLLITALKRCRKIRVVARAINSDQVLQEIKANNPNVALVSANLQDGSLSGFSVARELRTQYPALRTILLLDSAE